jgi:uncharacterized protein (DUF1330 family)
MKFYAVAEMDVTDASWVADYVANVTGMVERRGGRYLSRSVAIEKIEGRSLSWRASPRRRRARHQRRRSGPAALARR